MISIGAGIEAIKHHDEPSLSPYNKGSLFYYYEYVWINEKDLRKYYLLGVFKMWRGNLEIIIYVVS